jgi:hypothetical protein
VLNTKAMYHHYAWWVIATLSKFQKKTPPEPEMITLKRRRVCFWLSLLPPVSAFTWCCLGNWCLCSLLYHVEGARHEWIIPKPKAGHSQNIEKLKPTPVDLIQVLKENLIKVFCLFFKQKIM